MGLLNENRNALVGKTLQEVANMTFPDYFGGFSIFRILDESDETGVFVGEEISVGLFLKEHPTYKDSVVVHTNDFYGTTVLRVKEKDNSVPVFYKPAEKTINVNIPQVCDNCAHNVVCDHNKYGFETCGQFLFKFI